MPPRIVHRLCLLCLLASLLGLPLRATHGEAASEGQLKAAYLVNFLKYIEWPSSRPDWTICLFGRDSLGVYLAPYEGRLIQGRELHIRRVSVPEQFSECQALFVPETEESRFAVLLRWTGQQSILTVSDAGTFVRAGGAIALVFSEGRLQFDVNIAAMSNAGLRPGSQLMRLARQVHGNAH